MPVRIPKTITDDLRRAMRRSRGSFQKVVREGAPQYVQMKYREEQQKEHEGKKTTPLQKQAFLARLFRGLTHVSQPELASMGMKGLSIAEQEAVEKAVRRGVAKHIAPAAMQLVDTPLRALDSAVNTVTRGKAGLPVKARKAVMEFAAKNPAILAAAPSLAVPAPGAAPLGIAASGSVSHAAKKILNIPTYPEVSFDALSKQLREQGYDDVMDYLVKSKAKYTIPQLTQDQLLHSPTGTSIF